MRTALDLLSETSHDAIGNAQVEQPSNTKRLFFIGNLAIFMIGVGFAVRANIAPALQAQVFDSVDITHSASLVGQALGAAFAGFALTLLFGSALVDIVGMKRMLLFSALGYIASALILAAVTLLPASPLSVYLIWISFLLTGLGWGAVEAATNPMISALFPTEKAHHFNILHAWWPAGIVVGGLLGVLFHEVHLPWHFNLLLLLLPSALMAFLVARSSFPVTERVAAGISYKNMALELIRRPLYWVFWGCMFFTAASELAPGQWVNIALSNIVGMQGILLLVYVSTLMFLGRRYASFVVNKTSSVDLMVISCALAATGLFALSFAQTPLIAFMAATVWGIGVCFMWPTMLGIVAERYPGGGALALGLMGFAGGMFIQFLLPRLGAIYDEARLRAAGGAANLKTLSPEAVIEVNRYASEVSFQTIYLIPLSILPVFGSIWIFDRITRRTDKRHEKD